MSVRLAIQLNRLQERREHADILAREALRGTPPHPPRPHVPFADRPRSDTSKNLAYREIVVEALAARDGTRCYLCRNELTGDNYQIDHIIPRSLGGQNTLSNLALTCGGCNTEKAHKIVSFTVPSGRPCYAYPAQATADPERKPAKPPARPMR